jgi:hypothetical protein
MTNTTNTLILALFAGVVSLPATAGTLYTVGMTETSAAQGTHLIAIDTGTGAGSVVGPFGYDDATAVTFSPSGVLYTQVRISPGVYQLATVNLATGVATPAGSSLFPTMTMTFAPDGTLYRADMAGHFFSTHVATGVSTLIGTLGFSDVMDLAFDRHGTLYGVSSSPSGTGDSSFFSINPATAESTLVATASTPCIMSLAFDAANRLYGADFCTPNSNLYEVDLDNEQVHLIGATGIRAVHGGDIFVPNVSEIPEPASWLTLACGAALLCVYRRRCAQR